MTVYENLEFYARIKGIKKSNIKQLVNAMIDEMALEEFPDKISGRLSGGNKRKLSVAISLLCNPQIVLLDEPSTGMDPEARRFMWSVIHKISYKGQKSSVIMTTHSMDEAETLCKRMGIMVNGEFVCLGKANEIKDRYGYGYDVDVRVKPMPETELNLYIQYLNNNGGKYSKNTKLNLENINIILTQLGKINFINELNPERLGSKIYKNLELKGSVPLSNILSWTFYVKNALKFIVNAKIYFEEIKLTEHIENNFLFKMKKGINNKTIGFLFGLFERHKEECNITEYSVQQTSLEQIFNNFASKQINQKENKNGKIEISDNLDENKKHEIILDDILINQLTI